MLKFLCLLLITVLITSGSPAGDKTQDDINVPVSDVENPAAQNPVPAATLIAQTDPANEETLSGGDKDESLERSESFGFGWGGPRYYGGWGGWGGYGGYGGWGYGGYGGWGRGYYGGWRRRPVIFWG